MCNFLSFIVKGPQQEAIRLVALILTAPCTSWMQRWDSDGSTPVGSLQSTEVRHVDFILPPVKRSAETWGEPTGPHRRLRTMFCPVVVCLRQNEVRSHQNSWMFLNVNTEFVKVPKDFRRSVTASPWFDPRTDPRWTDLRGTTARTILNQRSGLDSDLSAQHVLVQNKSMF